MGEMILERCVSVCPPIPLPDGQLLVTRLRCMKFQGHDGDHQLSIGWPDPPPDADATADPTLN